MSSRPVVPILLALALVACEGSVTSDADGGGAPARDAAGSDAASAVDGSSPAVDGGVDRDAGPSGFDAGPCDGLTLASALSVTPLSGLAPGGAVFGAATASGGVVVATDGASGATVREFGGDGAAVSDAVTIDGARLYGFDASADTWAVMIARGTDALYLVGVAPGGAPRFEAKLLGEVDHSVTNNEWFGTGIRAGRLLWTGTEWAAYYTVNRLWPDGIAHYGDQLRLFDAAGGEAGMRWDWGCSHSMEVRLGHNGTTLAPVCASDCYPEKGIHVNHRSAMLYPDEGGSNCAGGYGTSLGSVVPMEDGFWVSFTATDARASHDVAVIRVANDYTPGTPMWLSADDHRDANVRSARYGAGFVVAWTGASGDRLVRFDAAGGMLEGPVDVASASLAGSSDFFVLSNGDVGWVTSAGSLVRLRSCP